MKKIVLLCAGGMSTSLLMTKMKAVAEKMDFACEIDAYPVDMAVYSGVPDTIFKGVDIILIGPQVRFMKDAVQKNCAHTPIEVMDMLHYGRMDGEAMLLFAKNKIEAYSDK